MGCYGAVLNGVVRRELKCQQCGDKFEHYNRLGTQRNFCDECKRQKQLEYARKWREVIRMACASKKGSKKPMVKAKKGK